MQPRQKTARSSARAQWRKPLAIATASVAAVALGAVGLTHVPPPAAAEPGDDSEALAQLIDGSVLEGLDADALADLVAAVSTESGNPSDVGPNPATIDAALLDETALLDLGLLSLPLIGDGSNGGLLNLGPDAAAGLLNGYAASPTAEESLAASGAVGADGSIDADAGSSTEAATLDLTALLGQVGVDGLTDEIVDQVALELGALASRAEQTQPGDPAGEYLLAGAEVQLHSPLVDGLAGTVQDTVGELEGTVNGALGPDGAVQGLLDAVTIAPANLGVGPISLATVDFGAPTVDATVDLTAVTDDILVGQISEGAVTIDLSTGTIAIDLEQLHADGLNGLDPNTNLLTTGEINQVTTAITNLLDDLLDNVAQALDDAILGTAVTVDLHPSVTLLSGVVGDANVGATLAGTLGDFLGVTETDPDLDVTGSVSLSLLVTELELDASGLLNLLEPVITAALGAVGGAFDSLLNPDDTEGTPALGVVAALQTTLSELLDGLDVINPLLEQLLTLTVNAQPTELEPPAEGDLGEDSFTVRALSVELLPNVLGGVVLDLASSTIRTAQAPTTAETLDVTYTPTEAAPGTEAVSDAPTFTLTEGGDPATAPEGTTFAFGPDAPEGATIDPDTGVITWTPGVENANSTVDIPVVVTYPDESADTAVAPFQVADVSANLLDPAYEPTDATPGVETTTGPPTFTDGDGATVAPPAGTTFELGPDAPADATIDPDTGVITWTPGVEDANDTTSIPVVVTYPDTSTDDTTADFVVAALADSLTPAYTDTLAEIGVEASSEAPTFTDGAGADAEAPVGTTYSLGEGAPEGATIDPDTGVVTWTPGVENANSTEEIPVLVTYPDDSTGNVLAPFQVGDVTAADLEPAYETTPAEVGVPAESTAPTFTDSEGAEAEAPEGTAYGLGEGAPEGATIDPDTGVITWTPAVEDANDITLIPVVVTYPDTSVDSLDAPFEVAALADTLAPAYTDTPAQVGVEAVSDPPTFTDGEGADAEAPEGTTYSLGEGAPEGASIDPDTGVISWTPSEEDADTLVEIPVVVTYPDNSTDDATAAFDVDEYNGNASASAAASANADDESNASAEAAAEVAANADATTTSSAAADVDATAAAQAAANEDASSDASADVEVDANASAAAAAQAAANADNTADANAAASADQSAQTDTDTSANANSAAAAEAASTADSSSEASANATAEADSNTNASASAAASANADDDSNASAEVAAQAAANDDASSTSSAAADADATAAAQSAANEDASSDASADVEVDANASAAAAAQAAANANNESDTNAEASAAADATAENDANSNSASAANAAATADSSAEASAAATADSNASSDDAADPDGSADDSTDPEADDSSDSDANTNASASAAASANADDDSNAAAEAAAQAAADPDADTAASAAADQDATAAAQSAANEDASSDASANVDSDANAAAAAAAQAAANTDNDSDSNAEASAAASAEAEADANAAASAAAEAASTADSSAEASAAASANASSAADGDESGLAATVRYAEIVRDTGVVQEVYGTGFAAGESVTATVNSTPFDLTATANEDGDVTFAFEVDSDFELGEHYVIVVGETSGEVPEANTATDFVVVAAGSGGASASGSSDASGSGADLPDTGANLNPGLLIGALLLLLVGAGLAVAAKLRRRGQEG